MIVANTHFGKLTAVFGLLLLLFSAGCECEGIETTDEIDDSLRYMIPYFQSSSGIHTFVDSSGTTITMSHVLLSSGIRVEGEGNCEGNVRIIEVARATFYKQNNVNDGIAFSLNANSIAIEVNDLDTNCVSTELYFPGITNTVDSLTIFNRTYYDVKGYYWNCGNENWQEVYLAEGKGVVGFIDQWGTLYGLQ